MHFKKVSVVGLGYIGLPTAAMFASCKIQVVGVDVNETTVDTINRGKVHIIEPDLDLVVRDVVSQGFLKATTLAEEAEAFLIAVPTPFKRNHEPDLSFIETASLSIAPVLKKGDLIVLESTSPVGATEKMASLLEEARPDLSFPQTKGEASDIRIAYCPERVLPGKVMQELITNDRIIGGMTPKCSALATRLYNNFVEGKCIEASGPRVAEMAKLTENSFRDVNIAFANELSMICDKQDIDIWELIRLANRHPRVNILQPGPGVGGHCIAVDPWFIVSSSPKEARLIRTAREVNDLKPEWVLEKTHAEIGRFLSKNPHKTASDVTVACYGIAFKPDIDDLRQSPSLDIVLKISAQCSSHIQVVEPNIEELPAILLNKNLKLLDLQDVSADIHLMLVDHSQFRQLGVPGEHIVDCRGIWKS